jgi:hypothetical protein
LLEKDEELKAAQIIPHLHFVNADDIRLGEELDAELSRLVSVRLKTDELITK